MPDLDTETADFLDIAFKQIPGHIVDVRAKCMSLAKTIVKRCPENFHRDEAIDLLQQVVFRVDESRRIDKGLAAIAADRVLAEAPDPADAPTTAGLTPDDAAPPPTNPKE